MRASGLHFGSIARAGACARCGGDFSDVPRGVMWFYRGERGLCCSCAKARGYRVELERVAFPRRALAMAMGLGGHLFLPLPERLVHKIGRL